MNDEKIKNYKASRIYSKNFLAIANGASSEDNIVVNDDHILEAISFSKFESNSSKEIYFAMTVNNIPIFSPELINIQHLKEDAGNTYRLKGRIIIPAKENVRIKFQNNTGASLDISVALHGKVLDEVYRGKI